MGTVAILWITVPIEVRRVKAGRKEIHLHFQKVNWELEVVDEVLRGVTGRP